MKTRRIAGVDTRGPRENQKNRRVQYARRMRKRPLFIYFHFVFCYLFIIIVGAGTRPAWSADTFPPAARANRQTGPETSDHLSSRTVRLKLRACPYEHISYAYSATMLEANGEGEIRGDGDGSTGVLRGVHARAGRF